MTIKLPTAFTVYNRHSLFITDTTYKRVSSAITEYYNEKILVWPLEVKNIFLIYSAKLGFYKPRLIMSFRDTP